MDLGERGDGRDGTDALSRGAAGAPFVGRTPELAVLHHALAEATAGDPRLVVVGGAPGIGKSRLLDEFARAASASGASVHWGRCREAGGAPPYWPWVQALRTTVRGLDTEELAAALGAGRGDVAQVLPEIADRLPDVRPPPELDPDAARFRLFDALSTFVAGSGRSATQVILLDDVHAADEPSLLLLEFVAAELRECHVLLVITTRTTEVVRSERLATLLDDLDRVPMVRRLTLAGLRAPEIERYLAMALGGPPPPALVATVTDQTPCPA
jgi:predicted ATPase